MIFSRWRRSLRATVVVPTFGEARFAKWPLESVRRQTVRELEIFVVCDGSPPGMVAYLEDLAREDDRVSVVTFPKSPRTGEPHRDSVIRGKARGKNVFYCCHDDLWFPDHVAMLERSLAASSFVHSLHLSVGLNQTDPSDGAFVREFFYADLAEPAYRDRMLDTSQANNYFGLSFAAHTLEGYLRLEEGWATTPDGIWTDLHMWRKLIRGSPNACATLKQVTALHFFAPARAHLSDAERAAELEGIAGRIPDPTFVASVRASVRNRLPV